jgi:hypothetical protein
MNAHFSNVKDSLDSIKKDTALTNSRVTHLEDDFEKEKEKTEKAIAYGNHVIDSRVTECPNIVRFEKLEGKMEGIESKFEDVMFFVRHPKLFIILITFFVLTTLFTVYQSVHEAGLFRDARYDMNATKIEAQKTNDALMEIKTRGVTVKKDTLNGTNTH